MAAHFIHHQVRTSGHGPQRVGREEEGQRPAQQEADDAIEAGDRDPTVQQLSHRHVGEGQHQRIGHEGEKEGRRSHNRRGNCDLFGNGLGGIAHRIQLCQQCPGFLPRARHLTDAGRVVGNGAIGIHGNVVAGVRKHTNAYHGHTVEHVDQGLAVKDK